MYASIQAYSAQTGISDASLPNPVNIMSRVSIKSKGNVTLAAAEEWQKRSPVNRVVQKDFVFSHRQSLLAASNERRLTIVLVMSRVVDLIMSRKVCHHDV
jgi:hypothetical protein